MTTSPALRTVARLSVPSALIACVAFIGGCSESMDLGSVGNYKQLFSDEPDIDSRRVMLDGRFNEWAADTAVMADRDYLYARVSLEGEEVNLQSAPYTISLVLDVDDNPKTGYHPDSPREANYFGIDLEVQFSPLNVEEGTPGSGVACYAINSKGGVTEISHSDLDLSFAPTHMSDWYEVRLARHVPVRALPNRGLLRTGYLSGFFALWDGDGELIGWSDPFALDLPPARGRVKLSDTTPVAPGDDVVRVVSYNTLHGSAATYPEPFARVIQSLVPDIIVLQEWDGATAEELEGWFTSMVAPDQAWQAVASSDHGIAIVSRHPIIPLGSEQAVSADGQDVRFLSSVVRTPQGDVAVGTLHLKCCGSAQSAEERTRIAQAGAINAALGAALAESDAPMRFVAGDFNLVGTREPLDLLRAGLDLDGSDLEVVDATVIGDTAQYTWADADSRFTPSRLDYALVGDAGAEVVRAFVLDSRRLSNAALARIGLDRLDTAYSDHVPVVVDIRPKP